MSDQQKFDKLKEDVKKLTKRPTDDEMLNLYALYKQTTVGDVNIPEPGFFAFQEKQKWTAWNGKKGMKRDVAMTSYNDFAEKIIQKYK